MRSPRRASRRGQLEDQITANEKQILTDTKATESDKSN